MAQPPEQRSPAPVFGTSDQVGTDCVSLNDKKVVANGHRIVTSIEFLSLANKVGDKGRGQYLAKQEKMLAGNVNLIEIDLLRDGSWVLAAPKSEVPARCKGPYRICVVRGNRQDVAAMYPVSLRQPLPTIGIPLRPQDRDVTRLTGTKWVGSPCKS